MDETAERLQTYRTFFARLVTANASLPPGSELESAIASTPREKFIGPPPWKIFTRGGYIDPHSDDPVFLYQDVVVSLGVDSSVNNGQPTLHAYCLAALALRKGERVIHVGAGSGYYTSILAQLIGETGSVEAYEIQPELAARAAANLAEFPQVTVRSRSGVDAPLPACDALYVNAGASAPPAVWLDALAPNARLLFPLTPGMGLGAMLLVTKGEDGGFTARFLLQAQFVPCVGAQDETATAKLAEAFRNSNWSKVKTLHRNGSPDATCWYAGDGWWLSME